MLIVVAMVVVVMVGLVVMVRLVVMVAGLVVPIVVTNVRRTGTVVVPAPGRRDCENQCHPGYGLSHGTLLCNRHTC